MLDVFNAAYCSLHVRQSNIAAFHLYKDTLGFESAQHTLTAHSVQDELGVVNTPCISSNGQISPHCAHSRSALIPTSGHLPCLVSLQGARH